MTLWWPNSGRLALTEQSVSGCAPEITVRLRLGGAAGVQMKLTLHP